MAKSKSDKAKLAIVVLIDNPDSSYDSNRKTSWITAHVAELKHDDYYKRGFEYVSSYGDNGSLSKVLYRDLLMSDSIGRGSGMCGNVVCGDISHDRAYEIEPVLKRMKAIEAHMERTRAKFGQPKDFVQAVLSFADAIGAESVITRNSDKRRQNSGNDYMITDTQHGAWDIESQIKEWFDKYAPLSDSSFTWQ